MAKIILIVKSTECKGNKLPGTVERTIYIIIRGNGKTFTSVILSRKGLILF